MSSLTNIMAQWSHFLAEKTGMNSADIASQLLLEAKGHFDEWAASTAQAGVARGSWTGGGIEGTGQRLLSTVYSAGGQAPVMIPAMMASGLPAFMAANSGADAIESKGDSSSVAMATAFGFTEGLALKHLLSLTQARPFLKKVGLSGLVMAGDALGKELAKPESERDFDKVMDALIFGAGYSVVPAPPRSLQTNGAKSIPSTESKVEGEEATTPEPLTASARAQCIELLKQAFVGLAPTAASASGSSSNPLVTRIATEVSKFVEHTRNSFNRLTNPKFADIDDLAHWLRINRAASPEEELDAQLPNGVEVTWKTDGTLSCGYEVARTNRGTSPRRVILASMRLAALLETDVHVLEGKVTPEGRLFPGDNVTSARDAHNLSIDKGIEVVFGGKTYKPDKAIEQRARALFERPDTRHYLFTPGDPEGMDLGHVAFLLAHRAFGSEHAEIAEAIQRIREHVEAGEDITLDFYKDRIDPLSDGVRNRNMRVPDDFVGKARYRAAEWFDPHVHQTGPVRTAVEQFKQRHKVGAKDVQVVEVASTKPGSHFKISAASGPSAVIDLYVRPGLSIAKSSNGNVFDVQIDWAPKPAQDAIAKHLKTNLAGVEPASVSLEGKRLPNGEERWELNYEYDGNTFKQVSFDSTGKMVDELEPGTIKTSPMTSEHIAARAVSNLVRLPSARQPPNLGSNEPGFSFGKDRVLTFKGSPEEIALVRAHMEPFFKKFDRADVWQSRNAREEHKTYFKYAAENHGEKSSFLNFLRAMFEEVPTEDGSLRIEERLFEPGFFAFEFLDFIQRNLAPNAPQEAPSN